MVAFGADEPRPPDPESSLPALALVGRQAIAAAESCRRVNPRIRWKWSSFLLCVIHEPDECCPGEAVRPFAACLEWAYVQRHNCPVAASR